VCVWWCMDGGWFRADGWERVGVKSTTPFPSRRRSTSRTQARLGRRSSRTGKKGGVQVDPRRMHAGVHVDVEPLGAVGSV